VDTSGASAPARVVESVRMLSESLDRLSAIGSGRQQQPVSPILFIYPAELPGMPLLIAAAWSDGVQAYSLPMLMQTEASPQSWQHSLAAGLRMGLGAVVRGGSHPTVGGKERWLSQAAEIGMQIVSDKLLGYSASSAFHDVAIVRCNSADTKAVTLFGGDWPAPPLEGSAHADAESHRIRAGGLAPHVGALRHVYYGALLAGLPRGMAGHFGPNIGPNIGLRSSDQFAHRSSFSYTSSGQLRCPAPAGDVYVPGSGNSYSDGQDSFASRTGEVGVNPNPKSEMQWQLSGAESEEKKAPSMGGGVSGGVGAGKAHLRKPGGKGGRGGGSKDKPAGRKSSSN